jgi:hypothetical protein
LMLPKLSTYLGHLQMSHTEVPDDDSGTASAGQSAF